MNGSDLNSRTTDDSEAERNNRNLSDLLQELRVAGRGVQVLFGCLLGHPFTVRFSQLDEIAARTVNKERARHCESKTKSRSSTNDITSGRRGGLRSHRDAGGRTRDQLYEEPNAKGSQVAPR